MVQKPWNINEAVILLEAYICVCDGSVDREEAGINVSSILRMLAVHEGDNIDEIYRNEAGISFQMYSMESAYKGKTIRKPATRLFSNVVKIRKEKRDTYNQILEETRRMVVACYRDQYQAWLEENGLDHKAARNYGARLGNLEEYAKENGFIDRSIYEIEDVSELVELYNLLSSDTSYVQNHRDYFTSLRRFISYRSEGAILIGRGSQQASNQDNSKRNEYQEWLIENGLKETAARNYGNWLVGLSDYAQKKGIIEKSLYDYVDAKELVGIYEQMCYEEELTTNHRDYLTSFRKYIAYRSDGTVLLSRGSRNFGGQDSSRRNEYQEWLVENGLKETAARNYGNWLIGLSDYAIEKSIIERSLYDYEDVTELLSLYEQFCADETLVDEHRDYLTSMKKYIYYRSNGTIELGRRQGLSKTTSNRDADVASVELSDEEKKCFSDILEEFFEEGLVLNAIRLDKFRMLYENKYGEELDQDDDYLSNQLKKAGQYIDGRVYPNHSAKQGDLIEEIREAIRNALNNGASCVYISAVMQKWQQELAEELYIYNETALRDIIIAENMSGVYATSAVFKTTKEKVSPDKDVIDYMKSCHYAVGYDELQRHLWFIPLDTIKHVLVSTPSLAQVDWETYMYAPNFPASAEELRSLIGHMRKRINEKGFLVSKDIAEIIVGKCPAIAINTEGYKDWAYRNVLKYILRDYFEFGNSVVSEKGKKLEMWQLYRGFCRDHELLSFEDLKQFSYDIGVQIYWDDVLTEMVRVNSQKLVRRDKVHFDVEATDRVLAEVCSGDYVPIKQIGLFLHFPTVEYPWNSYLLESYLACSKKFELFHVSYAENGVYGVVVRKKSAFEDYQDVVVDMLARSDEWTNAETALSLIVEKGYQARKRWSGFEKVVQKALLRREQIMAERK